MNRKNEEIATFAAGCFWCTEAIFKSLKGVEKVVSGYSGGSIADPSYDAVSAGITGHAESTQITFDPKTISYEELLYVFWKIHDPTTKNRQGADVGTQYRSVIFYHNNTQKETAKLSKKAIEKEGVYQAPIVTDILPFENFYPAENYHQDYFQKNPGKPYCQLVIDPKIQKLRKDFKELIKL